MEDKIGNIKNYFINYVQNIKNYNKLGENHKAKRLEFIILHILNKCNGWNLKTLPVNFPLIDLYDYERQIAVQVKSRNLAGKEIENEIELISKSKNTILNDINELYYFVPENRIEEKVLNSLKNKKFQELKIFDTTEIIKQISESSSFDIINKLFGINNDIDKTNGCYFFRDNIKNINLFEFLYNSKLKVTTSLPELSYYKGLLATGSKLYIEADAGRGKTVMAYLLGKQFLNEGYIVFYFNLKTFKGDTKFLEEFEKFIIPNSLIIVDNCHDNISLIQDFEKIQERNSRIKFLFCSRYFPNRIFSKKLCPNKHTVETILKYSKWELKKSDINKINHIIGSENSNIRLLSIIFNTSKDFSNNKIDKIFEEFYNKYNIEIEKYYMDRVERENVLSQLSKLAFDSIIEPRDTEENTNCFDKLYDNGLLKKENEKFSFPHPQDAIAFLKGKFKDNFIDNVISPIFEKSKSNPKNILLNQMLNTLVYNYIEKNPEKNSNLHNKIHSFYNDWKKWTISDSNNANEYFSLNPLALFNYYFACKNFNLMINDEIIDHFKKFIEKHRNVFKDNSLYLELLIVYSPVWVGHKYKLIDLLILTDVELQTLFDNSLQFYRKLKPYIYSKNVSTIIKPEDKNTNARIKNEFIKSSNFTEVHRNNLWWEDYLNKNFEFNNVTISMLAFKLKDFNERGKFNKFFIKASQFFQENIKQILKKTLISSISFFVNEIRRFDFKEYTKIIYNEELQNHIKNHFENNHTAESIFELDGFFHSDIKYLYELYSVWVLQIDKTIIEEYLNKKNDKIETNKLLIPEKSLYSLIIKHHLNF